MPVGSDQHGRGSIVLAEDRELVEVGSAARAAGLRRRGVVDVEARRHPRDIYAGTATLIGGQVLGPAGMGATMLDAQTLKRGARWPQVTTTPAPPNTECLDGGGVAHTAGCAATAGRRDGVRQEPQSWSF